MEMKIRELNKIVKEYDREIMALSEEKKALGTAGGAEARLEEIDQDLERLKAERHVYSLRTIDVRAKRYR